MDFDSRVEQGVKGLTAACRPGDIVSFNGQQHRIVSVSMVIEPRPSGGKTAFLGTMGASFRSNTFTISVFRPGNQPKRAANIQRVRNQVQAHPLYQRLSMRRKIEAMKQAETDAKYGEFDIMTFLAEISAGKFLPRDSFDRRLDRNTMMLSWVPEKPYEP